MFNDIFSFEGRSNRSKFWTVQIFIAIFLVALFLADVVIFGESAGILYLIGVLLALIPSIANQVKRWHDRGKSGFWIFIVFVPIIGGFWALIETGFLKGTDGPNKYGADPLNPHKSDQFMEKQPDDLI